MSQAAAAYNIGYGVVPAIVTKGYDKLARVKVRFPWMGEKDESDWLPVAAPMAGANRGVFFMPEQDDLVLVAFAYGDVDNGYVIAGLWSSADKPPDEAREKRQLKSKSGHVILLDDTKDAERISIRDKSGNEIVLDAKENTITITSGGDLTVTAKGKLTLKSDKDVSISGSNVKIEAQQKVSAKGDEMALNGSSGVKVNDGALEVV